MKNPYGKVVLITGASSGIGAASAKLLSECGCHVYGTTRKSGFNALSPGYEGGFFKLITMDVTHEASVQTAVEHVLSAEATIDILINCAGIGIAGAVEDTPVEDAMRQLDTNFFGVHRVLRAVLPLMRKQRHGLIINISSVGGIYGLPFQGFYSASKFALEGLSEALRMELAPFNVRVMLLEPGDTKTEFTAARQVVRDDEESPYSESLTVALAHMERDECFGAPPEKTAQEVLKMVLRARVPMRRAVGVKYRFLTLLRRLAPAWLIQKVVSKMYS